MSNLFSIFDPKTGLLSLNWMAALLGALLIPQIFWGQMSQTKAFLGLVKKLVSNEFFAIFGALSTPGAYFISSSLFLFIFFNNVLGLLPYVFTASSHGVFSLALACPLWIGHMWISAYKQPNMMWAHLVPQGTPVALMSFMVLVELLSSLIRPVTLAIRLAANMVAGHLLLTLLGSLGGLAPAVVLPGLLTAMLLLMILELAVAMIQGYVFSVLSSLYLQEVNTKTMNLG